MLRVISALRVKSTLAGSIQRQNHFVYFRTIQSQSNLRIIIGAWEMNKKCVFFKCLQFLYHIL